RETGGVEYGTAGATGGQRCDNVDRGVAIDTDECRVRCGRQVGHALITAPPGDCVPVGVYWPYDAGEAHTVALRDQVGSFATTEYGDRLRAEKAVESYRRHPIHRTNSAARH